jgi:hypothetical protein
MKSGIVDSFGSSTAAGRSGPWSIPPAPSGQLQVRFASRLHRADQRPCKTARWEAGNFRLDGADERYRFRPMCSSNAFVSKKTSCRAEMSRRYTGLRTRAPTTVERARVDVLLASLGLSCPLLVAVLMSSVLWVERALPSHRRCPLRTTNRVRVRVRAK